MKYIKDAYLNPVQKVHKSLFEHERGSLVNWAIKKIEYTYDHQIISLNLATAHMVRRVISAGLPIFSTLDSIQFSAKGVYYLAKRKPSYAAKNIESAIKTLLIVPASIALLPVALFEPSMIYKSKKDWELISIASLEKKLKKEIEGCNESNFKEKFQKSLENAVDFAILNESGKEVLKKVGSSIVAEVPPDQRKREVVVNQYIELFSNLMVKMEYGQFPIHETNDEFQILLLNTIKLRNPELRIELLNMLLNTFQDNKELCEQCVKLSSLDNHALLSFLALHVLKEEKQVERFVSLIKNKYFKDNINSLNLMRTLKEIIYSDTENETKEKMLVLLLDCFEKDVKIQTEKKKHKEIISKPNANLNFLKKKMVNIQKQINDKEKRLEVLSKEIELSGENSSTKNGKALNQKRAQKKQIESALEKSRNEKEKIQKSIDESNEEKISVKGEASKNILAQDLGPFGHYLKGSKNLSTLISLNNKCIIENTIEQLGKKENLKSISSQFVVDDIFYKTFDVDESEGVWKTENVQKHLNSLRAPWALVTFHSRLKQVSGKERKSLIATSLEIVESLLTGNLWETRHDETSNPHLKKVFSYSSDLKQKWVNPISDLKVKDLVKESSSQFEDYSVVDCKDPTDILLIGTEMNTCLSLHGRLKKVKGLIGIVRDGKTHTIVAKDANGKICAETQLQLMWDDVNQKPVLYVDEVNFNGLVEKDYTLEHALYNYAIKMAEHLSLELVASFEMRDPKRKLLGKKYMGTVKSVGSSAPLEYVNKYFSNRVKRYNMGKTYLVD